MSVEPKKWGVIYNPKAGTRKVKKRWKEIKEYMDSKGVDYDYVQSEGFGSVERLAKILPTMVIARLSLWEVMGIERCHQWHYAIRCRRQREHRPRHDSERYRK